MQSHRNAYARPDAPSRTPRSIEYDILARVTQALTAARRENFPAFAAAIHDNLRLWSALAADVASPGNALPAPLRAQLFYLYEFTAAQSSKLLEGTGETAILVDINTSVMRGLRGEVGA